MLSKSAIERSSSCSQTRYRKPVGATLAVLGLLTLSTSGALAADERSARKASLIDQLCAPFVTESQPTNSASTDHPLAGTVWAARVDERLASGRVLVDLLRSAPLLLLGEIHDNPVHHQIQACLLNYASENRRLAVVFEQISISNAVKLSTYLEQSDASAAGLGPALEWAQSGWPAWSIYSPIAEVALRRNLPILPGDPTREAIRSVAKEGLIGLPEGDRVRLGVERPLPEELERDLREELVASHCNLMKPEAFGSMAVAQRYRDAHLADALVQAQNGEGVDGAVLIAGNGHIRSDRGVPWHLNIRLPGTQVLSVAIVELRPGETAPSAYVPEAPDGKSAVDLVIFTAPQSRPDPCEVLREQFKQQSLPEQ